MEPVIVAVIPALNEEGNIAHVVVAIPPALCSTIIVVDNGSTDRTRAVAEGAGAIVISEPRRGYGYACAAGVAEAERRGATVLVFLDGDYSDYPEEMPLLVEPIVAGEADLVLGSRLSSGRMEKGALPAHAVFGDRLIALIMQLRFGVRITDLGPFHAIRADALHRLMMREMTYGWTIEMIVKAAQRRYRIVEVQVSYRRRLTGESKVSSNLGASAKAAWRIIRVSLLSN